MAGRCDELVKGMEASVLDSPGTIDVAVRRAAAKGTVEGRLAAYAKTVRAHAYRVTDDDVRALLAAGYSQDQLFEVTASAAVGAAIERFEAGMRAIREKKP